MVDDIFEPLDFQTDQFRAAFLDLLAWRRDVRRFRREPISEALMAELLRSVDFAPSVGFSQPWRLVRVRDRELRAHVQANFERCNAEALDGYAGEKAACYAGLKLSGLGEAPEHLAVFSDHSTKVGHGLGRRTMPETLDYSVVAAIQTLWLFARCHGVGMGWVSILDPVEVAGALRVPSTWRLIAYLCLGYPQTADDEPELQRAGWERRLPPGAVLAER